MLTIAYTKHSETPSACGNVFGFDSVFRHACFKALRSRFSALVAAYGLDLVIATPFEVLLLARVRLFLALYNRKRFIFQPGRHATHLQLMVVGFKRLGTRLCELDYRILMHVAEPLVP